MRGLDAGHVVLSIMDGLPGLEKVFLEEFTNARVQRCQIHVARNILAKVPKKLKKIVADEVRSIFYASSMKKVLTFFEQFKSRTNPMKIIGGRKVLLYLTGLCVPENGTPLEVKTHRKCRP